jgi:hypothetical protein
MSWRAITITGFVVLCSVTVAFLVLSRRRPQILTRFTTALDTVMRRHVLLRALIVFCWAWLGWHFLARNG